MLHHDDLVHAIVEIRPPASRERLDTESQGLMDQNAMISDGNEDMVNRTPLMT